MRHFYRPLYVSHGTADETEGLKQALSLARNNGAPLRILVVCPEFPTEFPSYREKYEESLLAQAEASIQSTRMVLGLAEDTVDVSIELVSDNSPTTRVIQYVLQHGHDLLVKEAAPDVDTDSGFKAIDMDLLRKCPCALWLCRPIVQSRRSIQVAVAIDPDSVEPAAEALSKRLLELSASLAESCSGTLTIVSCWDYEFESYLRGNRWGKLSEQEIADAVQATQRRHRAALELLINASGIGDHYEVRHLRGMADERVPFVIKDRGIDILVMGTVARTGIPGFIIGNTAENIVHKIPCSLMALKPQGFVSPVKAY